MKMVTVLGARPQFIKAAAASRAVEKLNIQSQQPVLNEVIVHTGQHYDENMSRIFFDQMEIPEPAYYLEIGSGSHGAQTGRMLEKIEEVLVDESPDLCLVYGDTNTTLAGALAAVKLHIPVAHIEAGLRSYFRQMPEEINRVMTDHISKFLFCPTQTAVDNLKKEGIERGVYQTGDVMYDCMLFYSQKVKPDEPDILRFYGIESGQYFLATIHRAENTDDPNRLKEIITGFNAIASVDYPVIVPLHPRTVGYLKRHLFTCSEHVKIVEPVSYLAMVALEKHAKAILTDSGGVQKEACFMQVPCITMRDQTEWVETVDSGWNTLTGAASQKIIEAVNNLSKPAQSVAEDFYGDGTASEKIVETLIQKMDHVK